MPAACPSPSTACNDERNAMISDRLETILRLEEDYARRAWIYAAGVVVALAVALTAALGGRPRAERRYLLTGLGAAGVWLAVVMTVLLVIGSSTTVSAPWAAAYASSAAMWLSAATGVVLLRGASPRSGAPTRPDGPLAGLRAALTAAAPTLARGALAATALTVLAAAVFASPQPDCGAGDSGASVPGWTDGVAAVAVSSAIAAGTLALLALVARRWVTALISLGLNPSALLFMVASTCAFY